MATTLIAKLKTTPTSEFMLKKRSFKTETPLEPSPQMSTTEASQATEATEALKFIPLPIIYDRDERSIEHIRQFVLPKLEAAGLLPHQLPPVEKAKWDIECGLIETARKNGINMNFKYVKQESEQPLPDLEITKFTYEISFYQTKPKKTE